MMAWSRRLGTRRLVAGGVAASLAAVTASSVTAESQSTRKASHSYWREPRILAFTGGSGFDSLARPLVERRPDTAFVLPVSDDGGSTKHIVNVLGGPGSGDIRKRCLVLSDDSNEEARRVRDLLAVRLPKTSDEQAKAEWTSFLEGTHPKWEGISDPYKDTIRAFLLHFQSEVLQRWTTNAFDFKGGCVGNFFFSGARTFFSSLDSAIFVYSRVSGIPTETAVLPVMQVKSRERVNLGAQLTNDKKIIGQNAISHPEGEPEDAPLEFPIKRVFYAASEESTKGEHSEVRKELHPTVDAKLRRADLVVYGIGSLWTSIAPQLIVEGVAEAIAERPSWTPKVLMLNGRHDRETGKARDGSPPMGAVDVVNAVVGALNQGRIERGDAMRPPLPASSYVNVLIVPREDGTFPVDDEALLRMGVHVVRVATDGEGHGRYKVDDVVRELSQLAQKGMIRAVAESGELGGSGLGGGGEGGGDAKGGGSGEGSSPLPRRSWWQRGQ